MAINVGTLVIKNKDITSSSETGDVTSITIENTTVQMEEGTVIHNGQPKKFNKKMSAYMIDMLTSEE